MKIYRVARDHLLKSIEKNLFSLDENTVNKLVELLEKAKLEGRRVFLVGAGRSGLVAKAAGMRFMHLDLETYVVGETITRPLRKGDVLIVISGSGETTSVASVVKKAKELGGVVVAITSRPESTIGKVADIVIKLDSKRPEDDETNYLVRQIEDRKAPISPLGTLFELSALVFLDSMISELGARLEMDEEDMKKRHTNIE